MYKRRASFFLFLFSVCMVSKHFAQIVTPTITINTPSLGFCAPKGVDFQAPAGATNHLWDFGTGTTYTTGSGSFAYTIPGSYTVTYSGTASGGGPISFSLVADVKAKPTANFSINPMSGCAPKTVTITDMSQGSALTLWDWTYGDGAGTTTNVGTPFTHVYTTPGTYTIDLTVTNTYSDCINSKSIGTVTVIASPTAVISSTPAPLNVCLSPLTATFSALSSAGANLSYAWNFGNTQTSTSASPGAITYTTGSYPVTLTVTSNGCTNTVTTLVSVSPTTLNVIVPSTVCVNAAYTVTFQANQAVTSWSLGNGVTAALLASTLPGTSSALPTYTAPGLYTITISAGAGPCLASITRTVYAQQVVADYTATPPANSCSSPMLVTYTASSNAAGTQFNWMYPPAQSTVPLTFTNTGSNPTFTFSQGSLNIYTNFRSLYNMPYAPSVTMTAISAAGCSATVVHQYDSITLPTAAFYKDDKEGCVPLTINYTDTSYVFPHNPITSYTWCNGATPPVIATGTGSNVLNQAFTYTTPGTYYPYLIIKTAQGCVDTSFVDTVYAANPPHNISFSISPTGTICPRDTVRIINTTPPASMDSVSHWHMNSDHGFFSGCIGDPNPKWNFTHIGVHTFSMTAYVHECASTITSTQTIYVNGPIVQGRYQTDCIKANRLTVTFNSELQGVQTATLLYGDGASQTFTGNPASITASTSVHTYSASGDYKAILIGVNALSGCPISTDTMKVTVRDVRLSVTSPQTVCANTSVVFDGSASLDAFISCSRGYAWYVDGAPPKDTVGSKLPTGFSTQGTHTVMVWAKDLNGCTDTVVKKIFVYTVTPVFSLSSPSICAGGTVQLTNSSATTPTAVLNQFDWDFGHAAPGNTQSTPSSGPIIHTFPPNAFGQSTVYTISMKAYNDMGCSGTTSHTLLVVQPNAAFGASQYTVCVPGPKTVTFSALNTYPSYTLSVAGAGSVVSATSPITYSFATVGSTVATLTVKDNLGCEGSYSLTVYAKSQPTADFMIASSTDSNVPVNAICLPAPSIKFIDKSQPAQTYFYNWNFGPGSPVYTFSILNVGSSIFNNSVAVVNMQITDNIGCQASITKTLNVFTTKAKFDLSKTSICLGDPVTFNIKDSSGVAGWQWDFGDGSITNSVSANSSPPSSTVHPYTSYPASGVAEVKLIYYSSQFICSDFQMVPVTVMKVDATFRRNDELARKDSVHCLGKSDTFYNTTPPASVTAVTWSFGDGGTSTQTNPVYTYPQPGVYQVTISVTGNQSCKGTSTKNMTVNPLPVANIVSPDSMCRGASLNLTGAGTSTAGIVGYVWRPAESINDTISNIVSITPSVSTTYSLLVTDGNGCVSSPTVKSIYVQQPPPAIQWDTTVVVGQHVPLDTKTGPNFSYTWTPPTDLSCLNCVAPISTSTVNVTYTVVSADNLGCFRITSTYSVFIEPVTSVDVPTAFTPNGDGVNDIIYVDGWGIKKLNYFRVYNRWGQLLFESDDIKTGWDGTYKGVPQNMETYIYQVSVETYLDKNGLQKTSSFRLIR